MEKYNLVNPIIKGGMETSVKAETPEKAGLSIWWEISKFLTNIVPSFYFTLKGDDDVFYDFKVTEKETSDGKVDYSIKNITGQAETSTQEKENFGKLYEEKNNSMEGGSRKRYDDYDEYGYLDDDSDDDYKLDDEEDRKLRKLYKKMRSENNKNPTISWFYYNPYWYERYVTVSTVKSFYVPTFVAPIQPFVEIMSYSTYKDYF